jgi:hypothetical protein
MTWRIATLAIGDFASSSCLSAAEDLFVEALLRVPYGIDDELI